MHQELQGHLGHQVKLEVKETLEQLVHRVQLVRLAVRGPREHPAPLGHRAIEV